MGPFYLGLLSWLLLATLVSTQKSESTESLSSIVERVISDLVEPPSQKSKNETKV